MAPKVPLETGQWGINCSKIKSSVRGINKSHSPLTSNLHREEVDLKYLSVEEPGRKRFSPDVRTLLG